MKLKINYAPTAGGTVMINIFRIAKFAVTGFVVMIGISVNVPSARAGEDVRSDELRQRCVQILHEALSYDGNFWINVHAAEALIWNVYPEGVEERFRELEKSPEANIVGLSRVMARLKRKNAVEYQKHVRLIRDEAVNQSSPNRTGALETLGKLKYHERHQEIVRLAGEGTGFEKPMARWVLANSGNVDDEAYLAELLTSDTQEEYFGAAYALRFFDDIRPETYTLLGECASRIPPDAQYRVYILSALYVHAPAEREPGIKRELLAYASGEKNERYEVGEALAIRGEPSDIHLLEKLLDDTDIDVRASAANALLKIERRLFRGLRWPDWGVIIFYGLTMLGIGWYFSKRQKTSEDYLVGGRRINFFVSGISLFAAIFSTITYLSIAGEVIKHGPLMVIVSIFSFPIIFGIMSYFFIPYFMKLPITSAYEIIEKPLGKGVRITGAIIFLFIRFLWMALLIYLTAKAIVVMMNWDESYILLISAVSGIITVIYSTMGGLRAVVTTDLIQFFILLLGAVLTIVLISFRMDSIGVLIPTEWAPNWDKLIFFSLDPHIRLTIFFTLLNFVAWWVCTASADQMSIQRFIATRDVKAARRAFLTTQIAEKIIFTVLMCGGFALLAFYRSNPHFIPDGKDLITDADFLFPNYIANYLPVGISGLVVAAIFSAAMSSLSAGVNSTAAVITTDIIPWLTKKVATDSIRLKQARWFSFIVGILAVILSLAMPNVPGNITEITAKTSNLLTAPLFNLFFMAMFISYATPFGTIMGSIYGGCTAYIIAFWDVMTGQPGVTFLWICPVSLIVSIGASLLFSLIPSKEKGFWTYVLWSIILLLPVVLLIGYLWLM